MRTGILLTCGTAATPDLDALMARGRAADGAGYTSLWLGERHGDHERPAPVPLVVAGALAAETEDILLGAMVKLALEHPIKIAEDAAVVDLLSRGRLLFGADAGADERELAVYGRSRHEQYARCIEALDIIVRSWTCDGHAYRGRHHTLPAQTRALPSDAMGCRVEPYAPPYIDPWQRSGLPFDYLAVTPKPARLPHPPVFVVAHDSASMALAAARGWSPIFPPCSTPEDLPARADAYWRALEAVGRSRTDVVLTVICPVVLYDGTTDASAEAARTPGVLAGTPLEVVDRIKRLQHLTGLGQIVCDFDLAGITADAALRALEAFAADVRPRLEM